MQYVTGAELGGEIPHIRTPVRIDKDIRVRAVALTFRRHNARASQGVGRDETEAASFWARAYCESAKREGDMPFTASNGLTEAGTS